MLEVGAELPRLARVVNREDVKTYADVGGDQNPLHQDDAFARSVGFDGIIAHGMFTMGHMAACVVGWAGPDAEVRRITGVADLFRPGVLDPDERSATVDTWVTVDRDGREEFPIKRGGATVRFR